MDLAQSAGKQPRSRTPEERQALAYRRVWVVGMSVVLIMLAGAVGAARSIAWQTGQEISATLPEMLHSMWISTVEVSGGLFAFFAAIMLLVWLETAVHEVGHLVGGWLVGFRFVMITVSRLKIRSTENGLRFGLTDKADVQSGSALMVPTTLHNLRSRWLVMILGGMAGNLLLGFFFFMWMLLDPSGMWGWLPFAAGLSFVLGIINLLPLKVNGYNSDGAYIQVLLQGGPKAERFCYLTMITGASRMGQRPRQWDRAWIEGILQPWDNSIDEALANHVAFYWALDVGQVAWADTYIGRAVNLIEAIPPALQPAIYADAAFFRAYYCKDLAWARYFLDKAGTGISGRFRHMYLRAQAAVLTLEGKADEARKVAQEGLQESELQASKGPGWELDYEWMRDLAGNPRSYGAMTGPLEAAQVATHG